MKTLLYLFMAAAIFMVAGIARAADEMVVPTTTDETVLCGKCGEIKGSDACCKTDAPKCDKCGLTKGSPGCCKMPAGGEDAELCAKCGEIKGSDACCAKDAVKCEKCGLTKGSPGCCKMKPEKAE